MKLVFSTPALITRAESAGLTPSPVFDDVVATVSQDVADFLEAGSSGRDSGLARMRDAGTA